MLNMLKSTMAFFILGTLMLQSCNKEEVTSVENFVETQMEELQMRSGCGSGGCYTFIFPISIAFPDSSTVEIEELGELKEALRTWKAANPGVEGRPEFVFPLELMDNEGNLIPVTSAEELRQLVAACPRRHRPLRGNFRPCFKLVYPVTVVFPNGDTRIMGSAVEMKVFLHNRAHNFTKDRHPTLQYPLSVVYEDGTIVEVDSKDEMKELRKACD